MAGVGFQAAGEFAAEPIEFREVLAGLAQCVVQDGGDGRGGFEGHLLVEEAEVGGARDASRVGFVHPGEHPQQGGLAGTVLPDQADPVAGGGGQADSIEDASAAEAADDVMGEQGVLGHGVPSEARGGGPAGHGASGAGPVICRRLTPRGPQPPSACRRPAGASG